LGAVSVAGGPQVLPARDDCQEAFGWLAQEILDAGGHAVIMRVQRFDVLTNAQLIELFQAARAAEYAELDKEAAALERKPHAHGRTRMQELLARLQKHYADIVQVDYFGCSAGIAVAAHLMRLQQKLSPALPQASVAQALVSSYTSKHWVTRPRPHVDRLACIWLIRRFIDPAANVRYSMQPEPDEISFDMENSHFGHRGNLCTFETMRLTFNLDIPGLRRLAELVHEIDLRDDLYSLPETAGVDAVLTGWHSSGLTDAELEVRGVALFEGLYVSLAVHPQPSPQKTAPKVKKKAG
jgi:hypothetical protein